MGHSNLDGPCSRIERDPEKEAISHSQSGVAGASSDATCLHVTFLLDPTVNLPQFCDKVITTRHPRSGQQASLGERRFEAPCHSLLDHVAQELLILADLGVQLIVRLLNGLGLVEADAGEGAWKQGDGHVGG